MVALHSYGMGLKYLIWKEKEQPKDRHPSAHIISRCR